MWLPTVPTRAHPSSSAAPSTARRSRATSRRSPRSWARVARAGVDPWETGVSAAALAALAAFVVVVVALVVADAVAFLDGRVPPVAVAPSAAGLVAFAVARRPPVRAG